MPFAVVATPFSFGRRRIHQLSRFTSDQPAWFGERNRLVRRGDGMPTWRRRAFAQLSGCAFCIAPGRVRAM